MSLTRSLFRAFRWIIGAVFVIVVAVLVLLEVQLVVGRRRVAQELASHAAVTPLAAFGTVQRLSVLPLSEFYSDAPALATEPGVSYLVKADGFTILMDTGLNRRAEHPSPLLRNMQALGVDPHRIDALFFSHIHSDHIGGIANISVSAGSVDLLPVPAYVPSAAAMSTWNPQPRIELVKGPRAIANGVASTGPIPRQLFLLGRTDEQALGVNLAGKGLVLIVGCGHQGARRLAERVRALFDVPVYAVVGGFHLPYGGGRYWLGPIDMQRVVGSDRFPFPWRGREDIAETIDVLQSLSPHIVAFSAHDSSDLALREVRNAFGDRYREVRVGREIVF